MTDDLEDDVAEFLERADAVVDDYEKGYMHADAAMAQLEDRIEDLREAYEAK